MRTVFVYGTLLRGCHNHGYFLGGAEFLGDADLVDYALYNLGSYPGIIPAGGEAVVGELYQVDDKTLARLDRLEGNGWLYTRKKVVARLGEENLNAEVYIWNGEVNPRDKIELASQPWNDAKIMGR